MYLKTFCPRKFKGGNQNFENWRRFFILIFVKNSKRLTHDMEFRKRTKIVSNKDDQESWGLTQIGISYILSPTYRWHVKFDVNVFNNIKTNVAI